MTSEHTTETIRPYHYCQMATSPPPAPRLLYPWIPAAFRIRKCPDWANCIPQIEFWHDNKQGFWGQSLQAFPFFPESQVALFSFINKEELHDLSELSGACKLLLYYDSPSLKLSQNPHPAPPRTPFQLSLITRAKAQSRCIHISHIHFKGNLDFVF